jgi:hypothetical protein
MATRRAPQRRRPSLREALTRPPLPARRLVALVSLLVALLLVGRALLSSLPHETLARPLPRSQSGRVVMIRPATAPAATPTAQATVQPTAPIGDGAMSIVAPPSVSASLIDDALAREGSPLAGQGAAIVAEGRHAGIDPVFLLAFVSHFDLRAPLPTAAHNVGHIRATAGEAALDGYRVYPTWRAGIAAWYALIRGQYVGRWDLKTLDAIVPVYAPSTQAGVESELAQLRAMVTAWRADN